MIVTHPFRTALLGAVVLGAPTVGVSAAADTPAATGLSSPATELAIEVLDLGCATDDVGNLLASGTATVVVRLPNPLAEPISVGSAEWSLQDTNGDSLTAISTGGPLFEVPAGATVAPGARLEDVIQVPGDTGTAEFNVRVNISTGITEDNEVLSAAASLVNNCLVEQAHPVDDDTARDPGRHAGHPGDDIPNNVVVPLAVTG